MATASSAMNVMRPTIQGTIKDTRSWNGEYI